MRIFDTGISGPLEIHFPHKSRILKRCPGLSHFFNMTLLIMDWTAVNNGLKNSLANSMFIPDCILDAICARSVARKILIDIQKLQCGEYWQVSLSFKTNVPKLCKLTWRANFSIKNLARIYGEQNLTMHTGCHVKL